jgi:hypothetical protein
MNKNIFKIILPVFILSMIIVPSLAFAENINNDIIDKAADFAGDIGLTGDPAKTTPITIIVDVINVALGLLGLFFVILIMYAGFTWMTSQGDKDKVQKAKDTIKNGIYGIVIILLAYLIANWVFDAVLNIAGGETNFLEPGETPTP